MKSLLALMMTLTIAPAYANQEINAQIVQEACAKPSGAKLKKLCASLQEEQARYKDKDAPRVAAAVRKALVKRANGGDLKNYEVKISESDIDVSCARARGTPGLAGEFDCSADGSIGDDQGRYSLDIKARGIIDGDQIHVHVLQNDSAFAD